MQFLKPEIKPEIKPEMKPKTKTEIMKTRSTATTLKNKFKSDHF